MTSANVELVREALTLGPHQPEGFWDFLDDDVEWDVTAAPEGGDVHRGRGAVRRFLASWRYGQEHWRVEDEDYIDAGDHVITIFRERTRDANGAEVWHLRGGVWTLRDGRVVRFRWYRDRAEALAAAGMAD